MLGISRNKEPKMELDKPGGVCHDPQRVMGQTVNVPHFNRDTAE